MKNRPKITVVMICRNSEKTIKNALESVISQDYENLSILVKDGLSADNTPEIIESYADSRCTIISSSDRGISDAFNQAFEAVSEGYIIILNSDDKFTSTTSISDCVRAMLQKSRVLPPSFYGQVEYVSATSRPSKLVGREFRSIVFDFARWPIPHGALFVSSELVKKIGPFSEKYRLAMDFEWMLRLIKIERPIFIPVSVQQMSRNGISSVNWLDANNERALALWENGYKLLKVAWEVYCKLSAVRRNLFHRSRALL